MMGLGLRMTALALVAASAAASMNAAAQDLTLGKKGLELKDAQGQLLDRYELRAKRWDRRREQGTEQGAEQAMVQDADTGELLLLKAQGGKLALTGRWPGPGFAVEQLCLHRDAQGLLHVFLLGEDGLSEQWLLTGGKAQPLRRLATPPEPAACRVRDGEALLYVAEPGVGLWAYEANAEREGRRLLQIDEKMDGKALDTWLAGHAERPAETLPLLQPSAQTATMRSQGDAADDPAIWVDAKRPARSLILGTDKKRGLAVYDLQGRERQFLAVGRINNVDLRQGLRYGGRSLDLAVATQRDEAGLVLFGIAADGRVRELARLPTGLDDVYGVCAARNTEGGLDVFPNDKDGRIRQLRLRLQGGQWRAEAVREIRLASQPEGCVVDEAAQALFVGEEKRGVWRVALNDAQAAPVLAIPLGPTLKPDVEGLALHASAAGRFLLVSSQGSDSYAVFDAAPPYAARGAFRIGINAALAIDGTSETDGLELTSADLGGPYREGLLVVQDGRKRLPQGPQNFKLLPWRDVAEALKLRQGEH
jgi:3-phytase